MIRAQIFDNADKLYGESSFDSDEKAEAWVQSLLYGPPKLADLNYYAKVEDDRPLTDEDFFWHYRVIGYASNGGVTGSLVVTDCVNPPTDAQLKSIDATHEHVMAFPGTRTAMTVGPLRSRKR